MANPFELINSLNGVNFESDSLARFITVDRDSAAPGGPEVHPFTWDPALFGGDPGEITVLSNEYTAGFLETDVPQYEGSYYTWDIYHLPTFGSLQFSNLLDGDGNPITLYIHGFSENGLLLTELQDARWEGTGFVARLDGGVTPSSEAFVLGINGVARLGDSNIPEGAVVLPGTTFTNDPTLFCFAEGTLISTDAGSVAVEALSVGDMALTASGVARPVKWIGQLVARPSRHPRPHEVNPVCVHAGSFGEGLPLRDLRLSPGHAVFVDGVLVPVGFLLNGATIVQELVEQIRYFHVELDSHDVLVAEGLPCESYLDDGNRRAAVNAGEFTQLYGRLDPKSWDDACAPLVADGPQLAAIRQMLHARAEALGWTRCEEADLVIEADGVTILPETIDGTSFRFVVPAAASVVLRSNAGVLGQVMPGLADRRVLGVAVCGLVVNGNAADLDDALFGAGFHQVERQDTLAWRWSDGTGTLEFGGEPATIEVSLAMVAPSWKRATAMPRIAA